MTISRIKELINLKSYDMDGCLLHKRSGEIIDDNQSLLEINAQEIIAAGYSRVILKSFSNRQSCAIDELNVFRNQTIDSFTALTLYSEALSKLIGITCEVDGTLMADIYGLKPLGENFARALANDFDYDFSHWLFDDSKFSLLYLHMHQAASENRHALLVHDVYEDRYITRDVLNRLALFFTENPKWIPQNLTLQLHLYNGKEYRFIKQIKGEGEIDENYSANIWLMLHMAGLSFEGKKEKSVDVLQGLKNRKNVENFINTRSTIKDETYDFLPLYKPQPSHFYKKMSIKLSVAKKVEPLEKKKSVGAKFFTDTIHDIEKKTVPQEKEQQNGCTLF